MSERTTPTLPEPFEGPSTGADAPAAERGEADAPAAQRGRADAPAAQRGRADAPAAERGEADAPAAQRGRADAPAAQRGRRKVREGYVVSDKMDKTVVVAVEDRVKHRLYGKVLRQTARLKAHDEA